MNDEHNASAVRDVEAIGEAGGVLPLETVSAPSSRVEPDTLSHRQKRLIVTCMMLPVFLGSIDQSILATALPTIGRSLGRGAQSALADHGLSDRLHRAHAALRQICRHSRPSRRDADRDHRLYDRIADLRRFAEHADADLRACRARLRRRRIDGDSQYDPRRYRAAQGSRQVLHVFFRCLHVSGWSRSGAGRLDFRPSALVDDLPVEFSALRACARHRADRAQTAAAARTPASARYRRRRPGDGGELDLHAGAQYRRRALSLAVADDSDAARRRACARRRLRRASSDRGRAAHSDRDLVRSCGGARDRGAFVRLGRPGQPEYLSADVSADRARLVADVIGLQHDDPDGDAECERRPFRAAARPRPSLQSFAAVLSGPRCRHGGHAGALGRPFEHAGNSRFFSFSLELAGGRLRR